MKLLLDAGNRRLKWALADADGELDGRFGNFEHAGASGGPPVAAHLDCIERPASVWVSCVAGPAIRNALDTYALRRWSLRPVFISARKRQAGIVNGYAQPAALGSDRWAALVAAGARFPRRPVVVVDAGTAVTVDVLDHTGFFRGGVIFPGIRAMPAALDAHTENIRVGDAADWAGPMNATATDTHSAVAGGALLAVAGGIDLAIARQRDALQSARRADCRIIVTGGDAGRVAPLLGVEAEIDPLLVLRGLAVIAGETSS